MAIPTIDYVKVKELHDKGMKGIDIAKKMAVTRACISKVLKKMGHEAAKAAVVAAPKYEQRKQGRGDEAFIILSG